MAKAKYVLMNGENTVGIFWEGSKLGNVFTISNSTINLNDDLKVYEVETAKKIEEIDLKDALLEVFMGKIVGEENK